MKFMDNSFQLICYSNDFFRKIAKAFYNLIMKMIFFENNTRLCIAISVITGPQAISWQIFFCCPHFLSPMKMYISLSFFLFCRYMESKDPTVFTKTYEEGVERVLKVMIDA